LGNSGWVGGFRRREEEKGCGRGRGDGAGEARMSLILWRVATWQVQVSPSRRRAEQGSLFLHAEEEDFIAIFTNIVAMPIYIIMCEEFFVDI
jgi:hypothetical protein